MPRRWTPRMERLRDALERLEARESLHPLPSLRDASVDEMRAAVEEEWARADPPPVDAIHETIEIPTTYPRAPAERCQGFRDRLDPKGNGFGGCAGETYLTVISPTGRGDLRVCQEHFDSCTLCHGTEGGQPGNSNIVNALTLCDYCSVTVQRTTRLWTCATCGVQIRAEEAHVIVVPETESDHLVQGIDRSVLYHPRCYRPASPSIADEPSGPRRIIL